MVEGWSVTRSQDVVVCCYNCMYIMRSCPDIYNAVHGLDRHMIAPREANVGALQTLMKYVVSTESRGLLLLPNVKWT